MIQHSKLLTENKAWQADATIVGTCSFTPGSVSVTAYKITSQGFQWAKNAKLDKAEQGYRPEFAEKVQLLLTETYLGFFMVPEDGVWNYHFMGHKHDVKRQYKLKLENPKEFYDELHRTQHFMQFAEGSSVSTGSDRAGVNSGNSDGHDREDLFE